MLNCNHPDYSQGLVCEKCEARIYNWYLVEKDMPLKFPEEWKDRVLCQSCFEKLLDES
jgi:hypothetical protein